MISSYLSSILPRCSAHLLLVGGLMAAVAIPGIPAVPYSPQSVMASSISTIFWEDFEEGDISSWDVSINWAIVNASSDSDGKKVRAMGSESQSALLDKHISTVDYEAVRLSYSYRIAGYDEGDVAKVEYWTGENASWQTLQTYTANTDGWMAVSSSPLPAAARQSDFRIRFSSNANGSNDLFYVDSVAVTGEYVGDVDQEGPTITGFSHPQNQVWPGDSVGDTLSVEVEDVSGIDRVDFLFRLVDDPSVVFPASHSLVAQLTADGRYEVEFWPAELTMLASGLGLELDSQFVWQITAVDALGNRSEVSVPLFSALTNSGEESLDEGNDQSDQANQADEEDQKDVDLAEETSVADDTTSSHQVNDQVLAAVKSDTIDSNHQQIGLPESAVLADTGATGLLIPGFGLLSLGLTGLALCRYGGRWL